MSSENYKRWPGWHLEAWTFWRPVFFTPVFWKDRQKDLEDGVDVWSCGISWLFVTVSFKNVRRIPKATTGFLHEH